jgi:hypothetical protein
MQSNADWAPAATMLRRELKHWISESVDQHKDIPYHGIHDEGSFTTSWDAYCFLSGDQTTVDFLTWLRDGFASWTRDHFHHGYYPEGECHHGTEPFTHFVARFRTLDPTSDVAVNLLDDAAEHTGNWADGVPDWYHWDDHRLVSWHIGSRSVPIDPASDHEEPDSIRVAMVTLSAYAVTGDQRYLDFCNDYGAKWAQALLEKPLPQVAFSSSTDMNQYDDDLDEYEARIHRWELVAASGMVDYFLDLYHITGTQLYADALRAVVPVLIETVADPRNSTSAALLAKYRRVTGARSQDKAIINQLRVPDWDSGDLELLPVTETPRKRKVGLILNKSIGQRFDQVTWATRGIEGESVAVTEPSPAAWSLAYQITADTNYAARAMYVAAERLRIGRQTLKDGRDHGCGGYTTGALASGHGRADRWGDVNAVFGPLLNGCVRLYNAEDPLVVYPDGLPDQVATIVAYEPTPRVTWRNIGDTEATFNWKDASDPDGVVQRVMLAPKTEQSATLVTNLPIGRTQTDSLRV